jgi:hypothetical protein
VTPRRARPKPIPYEVTRDQVNAIAADAAASPRPVDEFARRAAVRATEDEATEAARAEQFRTWLFAPLSLEDQLRIEIDEARHQAELADYAVAIAAGSALRARLANPGPTYRELAELRGEPEAAARAAAQEQRVAATPFVIPGHWPLLADQFPPARAA